MLVATIHFGRFLRKVLLLLEVILHMGAHRTGTTSLQSALQKNEYNLRQNGLTYWGPKVTRGGIFAGLLRRAENFEDDDTKALVQGNSGAIQMEMDRLARVKQRLLLISEENIMGSMRSNLRHGALYPGLSRRLARFAQVFGASCSRVAVAIRPYHDYWASAMAYAIPQGHRAISGAEIALIAQGRRGWPDVIEDVAAAFPNAEIAVWEFEKFAGKSASQFKMLTSGRRGLRFRPFVEHHNTAPTPTFLRQVFLDRGNEKAAQAVGCAAKYTPFSDAQKRVMQRRYDQDLDGLRLGVNPQVSFNQQAGGLRHRPAKYAVWGA